MAAVPAIRCLRLEARPFPSLILDNDVGMQVIATASADMTVRVWSLADFACVKTFEGHVSSVLRVTFVTRGMQLLTRWALDSLSPATPTR